MHPDEWKTLGQLDLGRWSSYVKKVVDKLEGSKSPRLRTKKGNIALHKTLKAKVTLAQLYAQKYSDPAMPELTTVDDIDRVLDWIVSTKESYRSDA